MRLLPVSFDKIFHLINTVNVTVTDISDTRKDLVVTVSGEEIAAEEARVLKQFKKEARIPGFRPGKAPEAMIRSRYKKALVDELNRAMNSKVYKEALDDSKLEVYSVVSFQEPEGYTPGQEISVDMTVDFAPSFETPEYKGLEVEVASAEVADSEIDEAIEGLRGQRANFEVVERAVAESNYVKLSYVGTVDGQPVKELLGENSRLAYWGAAENGWEEAGTEQARQYGVPEVVDGVVGLSAGEKTTVEHTFPDDFQVEALRGKKATYEVEVHEVRERVLPEIDEEFLKSQQAESLEDLKDNLLNQLESRKKQEIEQSKREQLIQKLLAAVDFPLPESGIEGETQNVMGRIMVENMQRGVPREEFEKNKEAFYAQARQMAERDVKLQLILQRIAKEEKIEVQNEDIQRAVINSAIQSRQRPEDLVKELQKDRQKVLNLQRQILLGKTLDLLAKEAKVSEKSS